MNDEEVQKILKEIKTEQHMSPLKEDNEIIAYIKQGEYDINYNVGKIIDYKKDLKARALLKDYVLYTDFKRLAEFKELYGGEYALLQAKYYGHTNL